MPLSPYFNPLREGGGTSPNIAADVASTMRTCSPLENHVSPWATYVRNRNPVHESLGQIELPVTIYRSRWRREAWPCREDQRLAYILRRPALQNLARKTSVMLLNGLPDRYTRQSEPGRPREISHRLEATPGPTSLGGAIFGPLTTEVIASHKGSRRP